MGFKFDSVEELQGQAYNKGSHSCNPWGGVFLFALIRSLDFHISSTSVAILFMKWSYHPILPGINSFHMLYLYLKLGLQLINLVEGTVSTTSNHFIVNVHIK